MLPTLSGVEEKLNRAVAHINDIRDQLTRFTRSEPYSVRVDEDSHEGRPVGRLVAVKNHSVQAPGVELVLLAGEAAYQLRSALDHLLHQLVIINGNEAILDDSRRHQFPIFKSPDRYRTKAPGMIDGVSQDVADII